MKVGDRLFRLKCLVLSSRIYFLVEDKEGPVVNCEKNLRKRQGRGAGGRVGYSWKNIYQEWNRLITAFRNGDLDEPLLQRNQFSNSKRLLFLTVRFLPLSSK